MSDFKILYQKYSNKKFDGDISNIVLSYIKKYETSLIDSAAIALSLNTVFLSDKINYSVITPEMEEAYNLAFPNKNISDLGMYNSEQLDGIISSWKGKYFEVIVRDQLNAGEAVGEIILKDGQSAIIAESNTQPGWDLKIINNDGSTDELLQLKATESISYVKSAIEKYPDISVVTTNEIPSDFSEKIFSSDISENEIEGMLKSPVENLFDSDLGNIMESVLPGLPFVLIAGREGRYYMMGKKSFDTSLADGIKNTVKFGVSWGVGALAFLITDLGLISIPTAIITRVGIDKFEKQNEILDLIHKSGEDLQNTVNVFK